MKSATVYDQMHQPLTPGDYVVFRNRLGVIIDLSTGGGTNVFVNHCGPSSRRRRAPTWEGCWVKGENVIRIPESSLVGTDLEDLSSRYRTRRAEVKRPRWPLPGDYGHQED